MSKFKLGDRVRVRAGYDDNPRQAGREFIISTDEGRYDGEQSWSGAGTSYRFKESDLEAVASGPVRTVTRKEIVRGNYGAVSVGIKTGNAVMLEISARFHGEAELRAAAATLIELADALPREGSDYQMEVAS